MNSVYLANVVIDENNIKEREPISSEAGRLKALEMLDVLTESSLFKKIYLVSQGQGKKWGLYRQCVIEKDSYTIIYLPIIVCGSFLRNLSAILSTIVWFIRHVNKQGVVISYNFDPLKAIPILLLRPILKFKLVIEYEELCRDLGVKYKLHNMLEQLGAKIADGLIVSSNVILEKLKVSADITKVTVASGYIPNYNHISDECDLGRFSKILTLLYAGRLDEERGIRKFVDTFVKTYYQARLLITGDGPLKSYIQDIANRYDSITYLGILPEEEFDKVIELVDICVNPQPTGRKFTDSSFPSKVVNYLAHGKIVISTRVRSLINSPYKDMLIFYSDEKNDNLEKVLTYVAQNKDKILRKTQNYPEMVRRVKRSERKKLLKILQSISNNVK